MHQSPERLHGEGTWSGIDFHWKVQPGTSDDNAAD
jgi:hypothetical protein